MNRTNRIALLIAGTALFAGAQAASADVHISVGGRVRWGGGGGMRAHWVHSHRPQVHVGGSIWIGGGTYYQPFAQPPPPPPPPQLSCNCEQPTTYYPIAPAPIGYAYAAPASPPPAERLPRFGIGVFLGGVSVDGEHEGKDAGLVGQFRLTRGLIIEGEIAKNELADGARVDRRIMAGLQLELRPQRRLTPYLAAAVGTTQVEIGDGEWQDNQGLAEIGAGLRYRISERFALFGDVRIGQRQLADDATRTPVDTTMQRVIPADDENYSRMRLGGMLTF